MKQKIIKRFTEATGKQVRTCTPFKEGFCNENYNINDVYAFRSVLDDADETLDYIKEKRVYDTIAPLNISEKIVYFDTKDGTKISKFVHGARHYVETPTDEQILFTAKTLKKLHNSGLKVPFGYQMFHRFDVYKNSLDDFQYIDEKYEKQVIKEVRKIFAKDKMVLCHNDLVRNNLLYKFNGLVLIDWEYAGMNNPYFDLASFISENNLNDKQAEYFLSVYFGSRLNDLKRKRVSIFIDFLDILFYYRGLYYYKRRGTQIYKQIALEKLSRVNKSLESKK